MYFCEEVEKNSSKKIKFLKIHAHLGISYLIVVCVQSDHVKQFVRYILAGKHPTAKKKILNTFHNVCMYVSCMSPRSLPGLPIRFACGVRAGSHYLSIIVNSP